MKHRHTFFLDPSKPSSPDAFELIPGNKQVPGGLKIRNLHAAREWKITIPSEDLAPERARELSRSEMTIQYVTANAKNIHEPLQRGFVQGFHVLWHGSSNNISELPFLGDILPSSVPEAISLPGHLSYLHVDPLPSVTMDSLFKSLWSFLSPSNAPKPDTDEFLLLASLVHADIIEFDIPSPQSIQIRAIWASSPHDHGWRLDIPPSDQNTRIEVGIFEEGSGEDKDEMALTGIRAILGEDQDFQPTLFTFPHRHHILSSTGLESILDPAFGSHPVLKTRLPKSGLQPPINDTVDHETCTLHALYTLSKNVFVDQYQLSQLAQFKAGGIEHLRGIWGETDLENPSYTTKGWGSVVLVDIPKLEEDEGVKDMTVELPMHLRYLEPREGGEKRSIEILPPEVFWACENTVEDFTLSPFGPSSKSLLHALFPADIVFYHLKQLAPETGALSISVPVADQSQLALVQNMTILGILMGFMYLFVKGVRVGMKGLRWRGKGKEKAKEL